ncbi:MAG: hypothetical protein Q7S48_04405 [bacterium]|nr:hypothetical protein [bacterium]
MAKKTTPINSSPVQAPDINLEFLKSKVEQVLFLLDASAMGDEVKTAWITLLPEMTLAQVDRLTGLLDEELTLTLEYAKKHPEDEELILKVKAAKERYDGKIAEADSRALAQLTIIEEQITQYAKATV